VKKYLTSIMALLILSGLCGCGAREVSAVPQLLEPVGVQMDMAEVRKEDVFKMSTYNGEIVPFVEEVQFQVDGILDEIKVSMGEVVSKGQVLATLDTEVVRMQLEELEEGAEHIRRLGEYSDRQYNADIEIAKLELKRMKESGASKLDCQLKEVDVQKTEAGLRQAQELRQLELDENQRKRNGLKEKLRNDQILAPCDGRVVYMAAVEKGDAVSGYTTLLCVTDEMRLHMNTQYIAESTILGAERISVRILDKEYDVTYVPMDMSEYISKILSGEEVKTSFLVDAKEGEVESGQFAVLMVRSAYKEDVLTVPANALYQDAGGRYVYKIFDGKRIRCNVTVGMVTDTRAEITAGLEEGDSV